MNAGDIIRYEEDDLKTGSFTRKIGFVKSYDKTNEVADLVTINDEKLSVELASTDRFKRNYKIFNPLDHSLIRNMPDEGDEVILIERTHAPFDQFHVTYYDGKAKSCNQHTFQFTLETQNRFKRKISGAQRYDSESGQIVSEMYNFTNIIRGNH